MRPFTCPRCRRTSRSPQDALQGYCGHCHAWTGPPARPPWACAYSDPLADIREVADPGCIPRPVPGERELTPHVLLDGPPWHYEGTEDGGRTAVYRFSPLDGPWVSSWRPDASLGACTVDWSRGTDQLRLKLSTAVMARAAMEELGRAGGDPGRAWSWEELRHLHEGVRLMSGPHWEEYALQAEPGTYRCGRCGTEFEVPPGHTGPVLCGHHSPPEFMRRVLSGPVLSRDQAQAVLDTMAQWQALPCPVAAEGLYQLAGREISMEFRLDDSAALQVYREMLGAGGCTADEARAALDAYARSVLPELDGSGYTRGGAGPSSWSEVPDGLGRGEVLPEMSYIPDRCPPPRPLPGTMAPDERHADGDTYSRTVLSDYDDPERVFL